MSGPLDISEQAPCLVEDVLSPREREVVRRVAGGMTNREAAEALSISMKTVKAHLANVFAKVGVHNRRELVGYALRVGII